MPATHRSVIVPQVNAVVRFETADRVVLEGELRPGDPPVRGTAVVCHPHPQHGGSKDHPLLWAIRSALATGAHLTTLAFNFRGVMGSGGSHGGGVAEVEDVRAAIGRVRHDVGGPTVVVGWSFGAQTALREAMEDDRVAALALVGVVLGSRAASFTSLPPLPTLDRLNEFDRPVLLLSGSRDRFSPPDHVRALAIQLPRAETLIVPDGDHFFWRREREVAALVADFLERALP